MANDWEVDHGLNPDDPADAALDLDEDGLSNLQEFLCGTDPQDAASFLGFNSVARSNNAVIVSFTAVAGRSYAIHYRDSLNGGSWQSWTNIIAEPINRELVISNPLPGGNNARFYRLATPGAF